MTLRSALVEEVSRFCRSDSNIISKTISRPIISDMSDELEVGDVSFADEGDRS
jgi:hypothetical protein